MADLIEVEDLAAFLNYKVKASDDTELDFMKKLALGVAGRINRYTGKIWTGTAAFTEVLDGTGTNRLMLRNLPVNSLTSVKEDTATLAATDYYLDSVNGIVYRKYAYWRRMPQWYTVVYNAGYDPATTGADKPDLDAIKEAALTWAAEVYQYSREKREGISGRSFGNQNESIYFSQKGIPEQVKAVLDSYRAQGRYV